MLLSFEKLDTEGPASVVRLSASDIDHLPGAPFLVQGRHILLTHRAIVGTDDIKVSVSDIQVLAKGKSDEAILVFDPTDERRPGEPSPPTLNARLPARSDDRQFLVEAAKISRRLGSLAELLLSRVRETHFGGLEQATSNPRKFVETPDNYWAVEIQSRLEVLKFIIRSDEQRLKRSDINYASERPPSYYCIKVGSESDIETAMHFLSFADRST